MFFRPRRRRPNHITRKARGLIAAATASDQTRGGFVEPLESRTLLTTISSGPGQESTFEYIAADSSVYRISLRNNITVEFIGVRVPKLKDVTLPGGGTIKVITPARPTAVNLSVAVAQPPEDYGVDLYSIYIKSADSNASLAIAAVPALTAVDRPMQPFSGTPGDFTIMNARTGRQDSFTPEANGGAVLIGTKTQNTIEGTTDEEDRPIGSIVLKSRFGERPATPKGKLDAGISMAPGVNIGQILIGGVVTGRVNITGSINTFYAGQILTGDAEGIFNGQGPTVPGNFTVGGDAKNIISFGSIGTDAIDDEGINRINDVDYKTGVDMIIRGRVGQIVTKGSFLGALSVANDPKFKGVGTNFTEIEVRDQPKEGDASFFQGNDFTQDVQRKRPSLGDNPTFNNDSLASAQFLGTQKNTALRSNASIRVLGEIQDNTNVDDVIDYYAITLLAGQTAQVQVQEADINGVILDQPSNLFIALGVIDPDGRVLASDLSNNDLAATLGKPYRFTAPTPGVYYIAVANANDFNFNGQTDPGELRAQVGTVPYVLDITRVGDIALGAIVADDGIANSDAVDSAFSPDPSLKSIQVLNGDLGALISTTAGVGSANANNADDSYILAESAQPITVQRGNLRAMVAGSIGLQNGGLTSWGPNLHVPKGSVGLLRATGTDADNVLAVNTDLVDISGAFSKSDAIGYDYQLVDAARIMDANLLADRGVGVVRAETISSDFHAPRIAVNADSAGNDGFIDLMTARGNGTTTRGFGTLNAGGPQISTGPGGNVRYLHVAPGTPVFRDRFFGGGSDERVVLSNGQTFNYTDDSGTRVKLTPIPQNRDSAGNLLPSARLSVVTYGVRDKGGSVLMELNTISEPPIIDLVLGNGVTVDTGTNGGGGSAEIGSINIAQHGRAVIFDRGSRTAITDPDPTNTDLISQVDLRGKRPIDVFQINSTAVAVNALNTINNSTTGEIVDIEAASIGDVTAQQIGIGKSRTGTTIQGVDLRTLSFPFSQQRTLIHSATSIRSLTSRGAIGNVLAGVSIVSVRANSDGRNDKSVFEGINGPVVAGDTSIGSIVNVEIGEGIPSSGSGDFEWTGVFASGAIARISNQGLGSDISGDIVANGDIFPDFTPPLPAVLATTTTPFLPIVSGIGEIDLINGSIIDADIMVSPTYTDALDVPQALTLTSPTPIINTLNTPLNEINEIVLEGIGGVLGSLIVGDNIGNFTIKDGFGFVDSTILLQSNSVFAGMDTDGYGLLFAVIDGGESIDHIVARGTGKILSTNEYTPSVRNSERLAFSTQSGRQLSRFNDLHVFLNTTKAHPKNLKTSVAGSIQDSLFTGARNVNRLEAQRILGTNNLLPTTPGSGSTVGGSSGSETSSMRISFAERVAKTIVRENVDGLQFTAGNIGSFEVGNNTMNSTIESTGVITSFSTGNLKSSASVLALGSEGQITNFRTKRALFGTVNAAVKIVNLTVGSDLGSHSVSSSNDIGTATINGSILSGALLRAADRIDILNVGRNIDDGATVRAKRIGTQNVKGEINGDIVIG